MNNEMLFTPSAILSFLSQIEELSGVDVGVYETVDGKIQFQIGDSYYIIEPDQETEVKVSEQDLEKVEDANLDTYEDLYDSGNIDINDDLESIESGLLKEAAKAMLLGGMIKLSAGMLKE